MIHISVDPIIILAFLEDKECYGSPEDFLVEIEERLASGDITEEDVKLILQDQQRKSK